MKNRALGVSGRPRRSGAKLRPRNHQLLDVRVRAKTARRRAWKRVTTVLFVLFLLGVGVAGFQLVSEQLLDRFFFQNSAYTVRVLETELDDVMTREQFSLLTNISEGMNIFSVNLQEAERVLSQLPEVESVSLRRRLPDKIQAKLTRRMPVAWVTLTAEPQEFSLEEGCFLIASDGVLMSPNGRKEEFYHLPVIYWPDAGDIRPGMQVANPRVNRALELMKENALTPDTLLRVRILDISKDYCIQVRNDQGASIVFEPKDYGPQLQKLNALLAHCLESGRELEYVNLMVRKNTPVRFFMTEETRGGKAPQNTQL